MSRFNPAASAATKTENLAGGEAFVQSPELEFVSLLLTSFMQDQFYRSADESMDKIRELMNKIDPLFAAKAALFARNEFGMRSVSHVVAGEIAGSVKAKEWTKNFFDKIVHRPDDMMEILSYYQERFGKNEPNALRKGFAKAFERFNEYHLAKYKHEGKAISLVDVVNMVHPKHSEAIKALVDGTLKPADTWETKVSAAGSKEGDVEENKTEAWGELLRENKLGYMALLKNLRNILNTHDQDLVALACKQLQDEKAIKKSLVLPFRFTTAAEEIQKVNDKGTRAVMVALSKALDISCKNVPEFPGETLVVLDNSGSMNGKPYQIGSLFASILLKSNNEADYMGFASDAHYKTINPLDSVSTIASQLQVTGGGTNFHAIFQAANKAYDRIIILSDMQGWVGYNAPTRELESFAKRVGKRPKVYSFDLAGHGSMQFPERDVFAIAGFSEKVFEIMGTLEQDKKALVNKINAMEL